LPEVVRYKKIKNIKSIFIEPYSAGEKAEHLISMPRDNSRLARRRG